ncbi:DUF916 domain-containing protein [bacterium]|nr:MAG: DUF916 domain-containing protein [bacterium]
MQPGQSHTQTINLSNTTDSNLTFDVSINDFVPKENTGQPIFLDSDEESDPRFSLSSWVSVTQQPEFTIPAKGTTKVVFTITVPEDAEPGTHYGGILFGQLAGDLNVSGSAVEHKAGSIILVRLGKSQEQIALSKFYTNKNLYLTGPVEFVANLSNVGNVHSKAKGDIVIRNMWGKHIVDVPVNKNAHVILPQSTREYIQEWPVRFGFGRYTAEMVLYYGNPKIELRATTAFWVFPVKGLILGVLSLVILGIIVNIGLRKYNNYIIKRSRNEN